MVTNFYKKAGMVVHQFQYFSVSTHNLKIFPELRRCYLLEILSGTAMLFGIWFVVCAGSFLPKLGLYKFFRHSIQYNINIFLSFMLENTIINIQQHLCLIHKKQRVTHLCVDLRCTQNPFLCSFCYAENNHKNFHFNHEDHLLPINESIPSLSQLIQSSKQEMDKLYQSTAAKRETQAILKKVEMGQVHYNLVDNHIKNLKMQIQKEIEYLQIQFQKKLNVSKQNIFALLDNYQKNYIQNMETYKALVHPLITFNKKVKYFANPNNICLKLICENKKKTADWYMDLKKSISSSTKIVEKAQNYYDNVTRTTQYMNNTCDDLPYLKSFEMSQSKKQTLQYIINQSVNELLSVKQLKPLQSMIIQTVQSIYRPNSQIDRNRILISNNKIGKI